MLHKTKIGKYVSTKTFKICEIANLYYYLYKFFYICFTVAIWLIHNVQSDSRT